MMDNRYFIIWKWNQNNLRKLLIHFWFNEVIQQNYTINEINVKKVLERLCGNVCP